MPRILCLVLGAIAVAVPTNASLAQSVVDTYPWTGINSEIHDDDGSSDNDGFLQPLGLVPIASGTPIAYIRISGSITLTSANNASLLLIQREHSDYSGAILQLCQYYLDSTTSLHPLGAGTYNGYLTFYPSGGNECVINGEGWYMLNPQSFFNNFQDWYVEGSSLPFRTLPRIRFSENNADLTTQWVNGTEDDNIQAMWFQMFDTSTSTTAVFVFGNLATSSANTTLNALLADIGTGEACLQADGTLGYAFCYVTAYLFTPTPETIADFRQLLDPYENKPPFAYFGALNAAFAAFSTTTTPYYSYALVASVATFFNPFSTGLAVILWVLFGVWLLHRIMNFDFHS